MKSVKVVFSTLTAAMLLAAMVFQPIPHLTAQANQEPIPVAQDGTTSLRATAEAKADASKSEFLDKATIEASPVAPDDRVDSVSIHPIPVPLPGGLNHVAAGVGTRNRGSGTIRLRGVCPGARTVRAFLYWGHIIDGLAIPLTSTARFDGTLVTGTLIGSSAPPCWPGTRFVAYRASVIALITPQINGDYEVNCLPSSLTDGRDPWACAPVPAARPLAEGASLVVVYSDPSAPPTAQVFINEGASLVNFIGSIAVANPLPVAINPYTQLKHTRIGADGQVGSSTFSILPVTNEATFLGPNAGGAFTQIKGPGSPFNGDADFNGYDGEPLNKLWDTHTDSFGAQLIRPGLANYFVIYTGNGDCFVAVVHVLGVR
jgi:hypothetical protein